MVIKNSDAASASARADVKTKHPRNADAGGERPDESRLATNKRFKRRLGNEPSRTIKKDMPKTRSNKDAAYDVRALGRLAEELMRDASNDISSDDPAIRRLLEEFLRHAPRAIARLRAHRYLKVSLWDGVDLVASRARDLFDAIPAEGLLLPDGASGRERFRHALRISYYVVMLAYMFEGQNNIEKMFYALQAGLFAVQERDRGFDEPFLRLRQRSPRQSRESHFARIVKAVAAEACEALIQFGVKDAARQVAEILNRNDFLPIKANGKAVVPKSVLNWRSRFLTGDLKFRWMSEEGASLFPNAYRLFREGRPEAARRRVLRFLPLYIETERRGLSGEN
jgi:hypothetical protein